MQLLPRNLKDQKDRVVQEATNFNQPLNNWNVSNVTDMKYMCKGSTRFNQPLDNWNVSNVTYMNSMFSNATSFNQPLNKWVVSNVFILAPIARRIFLIKI
jgi:surface protein